MGCCCTNPNLCPAPGDSENNLLTKILQSIIAGGGVAGVSSISVNGGAPQTGAVSIVTGGSSLLNFTDENANADGVVWGNAGTTEIVRAVGATGFLKMSTTRIHRDVDNSQIAFIGGLGKTTASFLEVNGDTAAAPGFVLLTTKGQTVGAGSFRILNAPLASAASVLRAQMTWEGDWALTPIWNDAADAFVAFDVNPTNTASAVGALLGRFRASSVSQWELTKSGATTQLGSGTMTQLRLPDTSSATVGGIYFNSILTIHNFGTDNFFAGVGAGNLTLTSVANTGVGRLALPSLTSGQFNTAIGFQALTTNTTGNNNCAFGYQALLTNTGTDNFGIGVQALLANTTGGNNVAMGTGALASNTTGSFNLAIGNLSGVGNTTGSENMLLGYNAGGSGTYSFNIVIGSQAGTALTTGGGNIVIGWRAGNNLTTGAGCIVIGYDLDAPSATTNNTLTLGNLIFGTAIDGTGTTVSSGNVGIAIPTPFQKFSVLGAIGAYELATDSSNYSRTSITPAAGNHLIRTESAGTGTLRILQVGTGPVVGANIAGVNTIVHSGQPTGSAAPGAILFQQGLPVGGAGSSVTALATIWQINTSGSLAGGAGFAFSTASGTNQRAGNAVLVGGTVTVANTTVTANTIVMLTRKTSGGTIGTAITYTVSAATSFTITSDSVLDTSTFSYFCIEVP